MKSYTLTSMQVGEILRCLQAREDYLEATKPDPSHGNVVRAAELALIDEIREELQ